MLKKLVIGTGAAFILGALLVGWYVTVQRCEQPEASGCHDNWVDAISALMIADSGILFWLAWVTGIFLIWGGMRIRN